MTRAAFFCFKQLRKMRAGKCFKSIQSAHLQDFTLATARAGQQQTLFAGRFIKAAGQGQTIGAALEALHVEPPEGTFGRSAGWLVVLAADKISGNVHAADFIRAGWTFAVLPDRRG